MTTRTRLGCRYSGRFDGHGGGDVELWSPWPTPDLAVRGWQLEGGRLPWLAEGRMKPVHVRVLGPLQLGGEGSLLRSGRLRRLLAALLIHHGTVVSVNRLEHLLWAEHPPAEPASALQTLVWRLREAVRAAGCDSAIRVLTTAPGYVLQVDGEQVDAVRFERLVRAAAAQPPEQAAVLLEEGLSLWRGRAYAEFCDDEFARVEAGRLEELRLAAVSDSVDAAIAIGRSEHALGRLEALVAADPLRERPRAQLMRVLHELGRSGDALQAFHDYRELLAEELGLDPSRQLRDLQAAILRRDQEPSRAPPVIAPPGPVGNLRWELTDLIGRAGDAATALAALDAARVVTLTGVGGVGKTRLALQVAADAQARHPAGTWICELAGAREATAAPDVIAATLGVQQRLGSTVTDRLVEYLRTKNLLLVLDNCEHVLDAAADLADALVRGCPDLRVLATSREPLGIDGERVLPVQPLPVPPPSMPHDLATVAAVPSVALFCQRAQSASAAFTLTGDNVAAVAEICRRLDGLPLALELAATRVRSLSPQEIADRLERRLQFLRSARRVRDERHRTLASVVDWSYRLLTALERRVFEQCSVFMGAFSLDAAASVTECGEPEVTDAVAGLVDKSMLVTHPGTTPTRFAMLETMRAYGRERLAERSDEIAACLAHASYHVGLAEAAAIGYCGPDEATWAAALAAALDDLRSAHQWALVHQPALAVRLSAALFWYGETGAPSEVPGWAARAADVAGPDPLLPIVLAAAAGARFRGDFAGARGFAQRALDAVAEDDPVRRHALYALGDVALFEGRLNDASQLYDLVADLAGKAGDTYFTAYATAASSLPSSYQGNTGEAVKLAHRARQLATGIGNPTTVAWSDYALGEALLDQQPDRAREALDRAVVAGRAAGNRFVLGVALVSAASLHARHGDPHQASHLFDEAIDYWSQAGTWTQQWITLRNVVDLLIRLDAAGPAAVIYGAVTTSSTATPPYGADAERLASHAGALRTRLGAAQFSAALARGKALDDAEVVAFTRAALAQLRPSEPDR
jgi:predicted ATPase/DNA-binding SARP family transcriptional activator